LDGLGMLFETICHPAGLTSARSVMANCRVVGPFLMPSSDGKFAGPFERWIAVFGQTQSLDA
jgi:hypothetical protein